MQNLVLTGLSGSGKSTLGVQAAKALGLAFLDTDQQIEQREGLAVKQIFERFGEARFRELEAEAVREAARIEGAVIATGGGAVLRAENMEALRKTGFVVFVDRSPEVIARDIDRSNRPLLASGAEKLFELARQRRELYLSTAHAVLTNNGDVGEALHSLLELVSTKLAIRVNGGEHESL